MIQKITSQKTQFNKLSAQISAFEKECGFENTSTTQLVKWLDEEVQNYKKEKSKVRRQNKLMDIIILCMQISRREKMDMDHAFDRWVWKSHKYKKN